VPQYGWIKNKSDVPQYWGPHGVEPQGVALLPIAVIENLRQNPQREIVVISDDPELWVFKSPSISLSVIARYQWLKLMDDTAIIAL
jgi:hypothetical protein